MNGETVGQDLDGLSENYVGGGLFHCNSLYLAFKKEFFFRKRSNFDLFFHSKKKVSTHKRHKAIKPPIGYFFILFESRERKKNLISLRRIKA